MKKYFFIFLFLISSLAAKDFVREYEYHVGDSDSKNSARTVALAEVKRILIEEIGVHVNSKFEITKTSVDGKFQKRSKKTIESITAGITKIEILKEEYDGKLFIITAKITVDIESFNKKLKQILNKKDVVKQLKKVNAENEKILKQKDYLVNSLNEEKRKLNNLRKQLLSIKSNEILKLKKELEIKNSKIKMLNNTISYKKNSNSLQLNQLVQKGNESYYNNNFFEALAYFTSALQLGYEDDYINYNIGNINYKVKNYKEAILNYKKFLQTSPNSIETYNNLALSYPQLGKYKSALKQYSKAIRLDSNNHFIYNNMAIIYYKQDDIKKAKYFFKKAADLGNEAAKENLEQLE